MVSLLSQAHGEVPVDGADRFGNTGLHLAARNGYRRLVKLFVRSGASLDRQNSEGNTALHLALGLGHRAVFDFLRAAGADDTLVNLDGLTCYQYVEARTGSGPRGAGGYS